MASAIQIESLCRRSFIAAALLLACAALQAQSTVQRNSVPSSAPAAKPAAPQTPTAAGTELDRVVAIVNGDLILDSDVDEERRFEALQPYPESSGSFSRDAAIERLINRDLILQQTKLQPQDPIGDAQVQKELDALRRNIPACRRYDCSTQAGWDRFLADDGFTETTLMQRWRQRMEVLRFIEQRFRMGIKITPEEIGKYYDQTMLPEYAKQHATPPKLDAISDRIQEVLLEQRVSALLGDWLKSLRAQGSVTVLHPGEEAP